MQCAGSGSAAASSPARAPPAQRGALGQQVLGEVRRRAAAGQREADPTRQQRCRDAASQAARGAGDDDRLAGQGAAVAREPRPPRLVGGGGDAEGEQRLFRLLPQLLARRVAEDLKVVRVLVNQAHTFGNGGSFTNGLEFTLSMGCGTWAGNSISENLNWRHFVNITHLVTEVPEDKPSEEALFGAHWSKYGK